MATKQESTAARVWQTLSAINVNDHAERKGNLTYLSWTWAWATLMEHYPASTYEVMPLVTYEDGTVEVWVEVTVSDGTDSLTRRMWLPCMDNRNNAIKNPDARKISDTRMRCLVKALAMFGLGHYIYAGEDLPEAAKPEPRDYTDAILAIKEAESLTDLQRLWKALDLEGKEACVEAKDEAKARLEKAA